jgi:hypothetical protein
VFSLQRLFSAPRFGRRFTRERRGLSGRKLPLPVSTGKRRHATCATLPTLVSQLHLLLNALKELSEFWPWCQAHGSIRIQEGQPAPKSVENIGSRDPCSVECSTICSTQARMPHPSLLIRWRARAASCRPTVSTPCAGSIPPQDERTDERLRSG